MDLLKKNKENRIDLQDLSLCFECLWSKSSFKQVSINLPV